MWVFYVRPPLTCCTPTFRVMMPNRIFTPAMQGNLTALLQGFKSPAAEATTAVQASNRNFELVNTVIEVAS